mgnify:CR=1 FL=1
MKIGMLAPPWLPVPPTGYGGIELVVAQLADGLTARGHQVMLFAPGDSQTRAALFPLVPAHVGQDYPLRMKEALQFACSHYAYARAVLEGAQLIHDHIVLASDIDLDIPIVHTLHGPADGKNAAGVTAAEICRQVSASGRPEFYVAISHRQRELYGEEGINWAGTVHNAVDLDMAPFRAEKDDYLFFIGRANWEKGLDLAVLNEATAPDAGFEVETNRVVLLDREGGVEPVPLLPKDEVAEIILDRIAPWLEARR